MKRIPSLCVSFLPPSGPGANRAHSSGEALGVVCQSSFLVAWLLSWLVHQKGRHILWCCFYFTEVILMRVLLYRLLFALDILKNSPFQNIHPLAPRNGCSWCSDGDPRGGHWVVSSACPYAEAGWERVQPCSSAGKVQAWALGDTVCMWVLIWAPRKAARSQFPESLVCGHCSQCPRWGEWDGADPPPHGKGMSGPGSLGGESPKWPRCPAQGEERVDPLMSHLELWPNSGLSRTTRRGGTSASGLPGPIWLHTECWSRSVSFAKGFTLSGTHCTDEESETQKVELLPKAYLVAEGRTRTPPRPPAPRPTPSSLCPSPLSFAASPNVWLTQGQTAPVAHSAVVMGSQARAPVLLAAVECFPGSSARLWPLASYPPSEPRWGPPGTWSHRRPWPGPHSSH